MNTEQVNELITSLESAGELSIKERKYLELAKAYVVMAAENVGLKAAITDHSQSVHFCEVCGKDDPCSTDDVCYVLNETPATSAYLAGIKADGVEMFAAEQRGVAERLQKRNVAAASRSISFCLDSAEEAEVFAKQLREGGK
jgi:hypothetical protein